MKLSELKIGQSAYIKAVSGDASLRRRLLDMGLTPNTKVTLIKTAPLGDPMELFLRGYDLTLRKDDGKNIEIERIEE